MIGDILFTDINTPGADIANQYLANIINPPLAQRNSALLYIWIVCSACKDAVMLGKTLFILLYLQEYQIGIPSDEEELYVCLVSRFYMAVKYCLH
jgi:hypothetical protein